MHRRVKLGVYVEQPELPSASKVCGMLGSTNFRRETESAKFG
jgi:hypothetical protein